MWCGRYLVMPGVKCRPIQWNQTCHHVLKRRDTTRSSGLGTPRIGCCCCYCFSVALAALDARVIAAKDLDSTPKALLTCRLPAASVDSTTHNGLVRPKRGPDGVGGGVGHGVRRQPTQPNNTVGPRFRSQWQAPSFMHNRRADHPQGTPSHWHAVDDPRPREGTGRHGDELCANLIVKGIPRQCPERGEGDAIHGKLRCWEISVRQLSNVGDGLDVPLRHDVRRLAQDRLQLGLHPRHHGREARQVPQLDVFLPIWMFGHVLRLTHTILRSGGF